LRATLSECADQIQVQRPKIATLEFQVTELEEENVKLKLIAKTERVQSETLRKALFHRSVESYFNEKKCIIEVKAISD
jgi:hypothetical protein